MADLDDLAAKYGVGKAKAAQTADDPFADLAGKYLKPAPVVDVGQTARRARSGGSPSGPRDITSEEAGTSAGPTTATTDTIGGVGGYHARPQPAPADLAPGDVVGVEERYPGDLVGRLDVHNPITGNRGPAKTITAAKDMGELTDPIVQALAAGSFGRVAGAGAGATVGAVAPSVAAVVAPAVEGGVASKVSGGDFTTGALLTGAGPALRGGTGAALEGAPTRVAARSVRNLTEDVRQGVAAKVARVAGPEGEQLAAVVERNPELRKELAVSAKDRPAKALQAVQKTKGAANVSRNTDINTMQEHFAELPPGSQSTISGLLDDTDALLKTDLGDRSRQAVLKAARKEITEFGDDLRKAQGLPPAVSGDYSGTVIPPKDLRALEQTIGDRAYEGIPIERKATVKGRVNAELYKPLARQMNALAEATPGVDAAHFAATGQDIHVLIPVEEALQARVDRLLQGKRSFAENVRHYSHLIASAPGLAVGFAAHSPLAAAAVPAGIAAAKVAGRIGRGLDYQLAEAQLRRQAIPPVAAPARIAPAAVGVTAAQTERRAPSLADLYAVPAQ